MRIRAAGLTGAAALAAVAITLTSCASADPTGGPASSTPAAGASGAAGGAAHQAQHQQPQHRPPAPLVEASRLEALADLPAARRMLRHVPESPLAGFGKGRSETSGPTVSHAYRVAMSITQAQDWMASHAPSGLRPGRYLVPQTELHPSVLTYSYEATTGHLTITIVKAGANSTTWTVTGSVAR